LSLVLHQLPENNFYIKKNHTSCTTHPYLSDSRRSRSAAESSSVGRASIREIKRLVDNIEAASGQKVHPHGDGHPGLPPTQIGVDAEIEALKKGVAAIYPDIDGIPPLKTGDIPLCEIVYEH
jgi:hypothetical protein